MHCTKFQHVIHFLKQPNFNVWKQNHLEPLKLIYIAMWIMFFNVVSIKNVFLP